MTSLSLYLDDCAYSKRLRRMLLEAGHEVVTPFDANLAGGTDLTHFNYARQHSLVIITKDAGDFAELHRQNQAHAGILAICEEADRSKNMTYQDVVNAVNNISSAEIELPGQFLVLSHRRW